VSPSFEQVIGLIVPVDLPSCSDRNHEMPETAIEAAIIRGFLKPEETTRAWSVIQSVYAAQLSDRALKRLTDNAVLDIRLIVDHENEQVHTRSSDLIRDAPARGRTIRTL
jgi:hypothetical protein